MPLFKTGQGVVKGGRAGILLGTISNVRVLIRSSYPESLLNLATLLSVCSVCLSGGIKMKRLRSADVKEQEGWGPPNRWRTAALKNK